ncbi:MAG: 1-acyl-sn-glycerol-3-phosphate acyltransferase [Deltaproteobacteria bacterium]|nr:1-acyl-sn-glycerol-3-phosphate acyltransferase [Deltaproteobacteria bacterium]
MMALLRNIISIFLGLLLILLFSILGIVVYLITWNPIKTTDLLKGPYGKAMLWISGIKVALENKHFLTQYKPVVFVGNHQSLLDIFLFPSFLPKGVFFIGKKEIFNYPLMGWVFRLVGQIPIDREDHQKAMRSMKKIQTRVVHEKVSAFFCPEGTRTTDGKLLPFKKGAFYLAMQEHIPLVPIIIYNAFEAMKKGSLRIKTGTIRVKVLEPIITQDWNKDNLDQKIEEIRNLFLKELGK